MSILLLGKKPRWIWHWYLGSYEGDVAILWSKHLKRQYKIKFIQPKIKVHILVVKIIRRDFPSNFKDFSSLRFQNLQLKKKSLMQELQSDILWPVSPMTVMTAVLYCFHN